MFIAKVKSLSKRHKTVIWGICLFPIFMIINQAKLLNSCKPSYHA